MKLEQFMLQRKADWERLTALLEKCSAGPERLSPEEVRDLGRLYRSAAADLALAQRDFPRERTTAYLHQLAGRAHSVIYRAEPMAGRQAMRFFRFTVPNTFRAGLPFFLAACAFFIIPAAFSGIATAIDPDAAAWMLPAEVQETRDYLERRELWTDIPVEKRPYASSFIMQNNIRVALLAFAGGISFNLLTVYLLALNGFILGGVTGLALFYGVGGELWTFVIGHGVIELSVICLAGGCGLQIGWALIHPGFISRKDALAAAAQKAVRLALFSALLLVVAGLIEGFLSPAEHVPAWIKAAVGIGSGAVLYAYLFLAGRPGRQSSRRPFSSK
ncbi:MAG: stage II sporulation protein M [Anaerolineales bacterium]|nr:stage II sporulation protein M [Anaerolineales bacterium]